MAKLPSVRPRYVLGQGCRQLKGEHDYAYADEGRTFCRKCGAVKPRDYCQYTKKPCNRKVHSPSSKFCILHYYGTDHPTEELCPVCRGRGIVKRKEKQSG